MYQDPMDAVFEASDKRKAGAVLAAYLSPTLLSLIDNQEESPINQMFGAPATVAAGAIAGGLLGQLTTGKISDEATEEALRKIVVELKNEAKGVRDKEGPQAANEFFGRQKAERTDAYRKAQTQDNSSIDRSGITPRMLRRIQNGQLIGAGLAAPLAYSMLRDGEIEQ